MTAQIPSGTVTFLFTDIEGSTRRWDRQRAAMKRALERHDALLQAAIVQHGGHVFKTVGDAFHAAFASATDAVAAAVAAQRAVHAEDWSAFSSDFAQLGVRMALHTGAAELRDGDYFGPPLNRTARLTAAGHGGQILLSLATQQLVRDELSEDVQLRDLGVHRLKDLSHSEHIFRLVVADLPEVVTPPDTAEELRPSERAHFDAELLPAECPYRGLFAFREEDAGFFFGRETFTARLVEAVEQTSMVAVIGPSGSGKSSVIFAGLLPRLRDSDAGGDGRQPWHVIAFRPGSRPFEALAEVLVPLLESGMSATDRLIEIRKLATALAGAALDLSSVMREIRAKHPVLGRPLLVVDQFEELYTLCQDPDTRRRFLDVLFEAIDASRLEPAARLALTLRADFMGHASAYRPFADALQDHNVILGPMTHEELARAIASPAAKQGRAFESGLAERIMGDVGDEPGNLPLLEFALTTLWERQSAGWLTHDAYEAIGRVEGALAGYADQVYKQLRPEEQEVARRVFVQLVRPGEGTEDTRRVATRAELGDAAWPLVQKLADARLVVTNRDAGGHETAEVVHEALLRSWGRLRQWMEQDRTFRTWQERLRFALRQWEASGHDEGALLRGAPLAEAEGWLGQRGRELGEAERGFVEHGVDVRDREFTERHAQLEREAASAKSLRRRAVFLAGALVVAGILGIAAVVLGQQAVSSARRADSERQRAEHEARVARSRELAAASTINLDVDPERSILLALQAISETRAVDGTTLPEAETALHRAINASRLQLTLRGHSDRIIRARFSPDGTRIVTASEDNTARVWDASDGRGILVLAGHTDKLVDAAFSPDGKTIATASLDKTIKLWDAVSGHALRTLSGHTDAVYSVTFSPDGQHLASRGKDLTVRYWSISSSVELQRYSILSEGSLSLSFSPDGKRLASTTSQISSTASIWDLSTGKQQLLTGHSATIRGLAFSPDGSHIATTSADRSMKVWDVLTGRELLTLTDNTLAAAGIAFSPDGTHIATANIDSTATLWDSISGRELSKFVGAAANLGVLRFTPDGKRLIGSGIFSAAKVWEVASGNEIVTLAGHRGRVTSIDVSPDSKRVLTASEDGTAKVWNIDPRGESLILAQPPSVSWLAISRDGARIATDGEDKSATVKVWETDTGREVMVIADIVKPSADIDFSPDGTRIVTTALEGTMQTTLWDLASGKALQTLAGHSKGVLDAVFSPDGKRLATASSDMTAKVWDLSTGRELLTLAGHTGVIYQVRFSPDGKQLATAGYDKVAKVWDATSGQELHTLRGHTGAVRDVAFIPDGSLLATASSDTTARLWDSRTGRQLRTLVGHSTKVSSVAFSADGKYLATASDDKTAKVWDVATGRELITLIGHTRGVQGAVFTPDGKRLITAAWDGTIRTWILPIDELVALARSRVTRALTADECRQYLHLDTCPAETGLPTEESP